MEFVLLMNLFWIPLLPLLGTLMPLLTERFGRSACALMTEIRSISRKKGISTA